MANVAVLYSLRGASHVKSSTAVFACLVRKLLFKRPMNPKRDEEGGEEKEKRRREKVNKGGRGAVNKEEA